jgi:hypothetical protein
MGKQPEHKQWAVGLLGCKGVEANDTLNVAVCTACNPPYTPACLFDAEADAEVQLGDGLS